MESQGGYFDEPSIENTFSNSYTLFCLPQNPITLFQILDVFILHYNVDVDKKKIMKNNSFQWEAIVQLLMALLGFK